MGVPILTTSHTPVTSLCLSWLADPRAKSRRAGGPNQGPVVEDENSGHSRLGALQGSLLGCSRLLQPAAFSHSSALHGRWGVMRPVHN